jgi:hypothetical protein
LALAVDEEGVGMAAHGTFECVEQSSCLSHDNAFVSVGRIARRVYATALVACKLDFAVASSPIFSIMEILSDTV